MAMAPARLPVGLKCAHVASMIGDLRRAQNEGASWDTLGVHLDRLLVDARDQFAVEEVAMEAAGYPHLDAHRNEHHIFLRRVDVVRIECDRKETDLMPLLIEMLDNWFRCHDETWDTP